MNFSAIKDYKGDGRYYVHAVIVRNLDKLTFRPEDDIIDVGCGTGEETKALARKVNSATGIDTSDEMLAVAHANNSAPNITYNWGDARTIGDNPDYLGRFDKAVSFFVLHWFPDHAKALRSILACLKPGGEVLLIVSKPTTFAKEALAFLSSHAKWGEYMQAYNSPYYFWNQSVAEMEQLFESCGWTNPRSEIQYFLPETELRTKIFLKTVWAASTQIPESDQEAYLEDLWQWALSRYPDETRPGYVFFPIQLLVTHASKPL
ncbi:juvenile hormone acid O-methyltransferase-like [Patiria miniata]|uniref:Methyltransferase type 11 domain-containing protein n=1 Tax=Patiria miniata TaxID=46514 RepID=A0A914B8C2_PATMI|nr:juvenile hormone acid O-methyltransferase-like [Patiria miniata]